MIKKLILFPLILFTIMTVLITALAVAEVIKKTESENDYAPGQLVILIKKNVPDSRIIEILQGVNATLIEKTKLDTFDFDILLVHVETNKELDTIRLLQKYPEVKNVDLNYYGMY